MTGRGAHQKKAQNILSVRARHELLIAGIQTPSGVDKAVHASLTGQRAFAALNLTKLKITPVALNTLKSLANELFTEPDGNGCTGFAYIDGLRVRLGQSLSKAAVTRTIEAKAERTENKTSILESRLAAAEAQSLKRQKAYLSLYSAINGLIKNAGLHADAELRLYRILENHHATFSCLFEPSIGSTAGIEAQVTKLREKNPPN